MAPARYIQHIQNHQLQNIQVSPYKLNGNKFNNLVASLNGFNYFAFYKGKVINGAAIRSNRDNCNKAKASPTALSTPLSVCKKDPLSTLPKKERTEIKKLLKNPSIRNIIYVTHVGVYAGDLYEFNGTQYLAT